MPWTAASGSAAERAGVEGELHGRAGDVEVGPVEHAELDQGRHGAQPRVARRSSRADRVDPTVDVDDLPRGLGEPVRQQRHARLRRRASGRRGPSRSAPASSRPRRTRRSPGSTCAAMVLIGPGGHQVDPDALGPEVARQVAGRRLERRLGHAHPVVRRPGDGGVEGRGRPPRRPAASAAGRPSSSDFSEYADTCTAVATSSHGVLRKLPPIADAGANADRVQDAVDAVHVLARRGRPARPGPPRWSRRAR